MKPTTCFAPAHILLPSEQVPLEQWGCIACDQFTSDRSYWQRAEKTAAVVCRKINYNIIACINDLGSIKRKTFDGRINHKRQTA